MKLYRFMSQQEYKALAMGKTIISDVDYKKLGRKSTAKGVCFGIGDYEQAKKDFRHLNGIVVPHYLVVFDKPDTLTFTKCQGRYTDWEKFDRLYSPKKRYSMAYILGAVPMKMCDEYCTPYYSLNDIVETYEVYQVTNSLGNLETVRRI